MLNREKRLILLTSALLLVLGWYLYPNFFGPSDGAVTERQAVLPGNNELIAVRLIKTEPYQSQLEIEYFYNGAYGPRAKIQADVPFDRVGSNSVHQPSRSFVATSAGKNKATVRVSRFQEHHLKARTQTVKISMTNLAGDVLIERNFDQVIDWPSSDPFLLRSADSQDIERLYRLCVETIDSGRNLDGAKRGLEEILLANPQYLPVYAEIARYHMKTNWNQEGLGQAERSLKSALRIDPKHANSLVLLGYVYAHQRRFKESEQTLRDAEAIGTPNIWLYANLGEMYAMQGKKKQAIEEYIKAVEAPQDLETYERARADAYEKVLAILISEKQWKQVEERHLQRVDKFPQNGCYKAEHADFRLRRMGDIDNAIVIGTRGLEQGCAERAKQTLGMAYFAKWAASLKAGMQPAEADQFYNRGLALYADVPGLMYGLAGSEHTVHVVAHLKRRGVSIDTPDSNGMTALAYSILNADLDTGRALIAHGANVNQQLNEDGFTPLMLAASRGDEKYVSLLVKSGAGRKTKTRSGYSAEMIAKERGFDTVVSLLVGRVGI